MRSPQSHHTDADRACAAWSRIQERPTDVVFDRDGSPLASQCIRVEFKPTDVTEIKTSLNKGGRASRGEAAIFGIKDHPIEDDTDMQRLDRFKLGDNVYEIQIVVAWQGELQARAEIIT